MPPSTDPAGVAAYYPLAHRLAARHRRRAADHEDLVQEGMKSLVDNAQELAEAARPVAMARWLLSNAMVNYGRNPRTRPRPHRSIDAAADDGETECPALLAEDGLVAWPSYLEAVAVEAFLEEVETKVGPEAAAMVQELQVASHATGRRVVREMEEKRRRRAQGEAVRGGARPRVYIRHIAATVGVPAGSGWYRRLRRIRAIAKRHFEVEEEE